MYKATRHGDRPSEKTKRGEKKEKNIAAFVAAAVKQNKRRPASACHPSSLWKQSASYVQEKPGHAHHGENSLRRWAKPRAQSLSPKCEKMEEKIVTGHVPTPIAITTVLGSHVGLSAVLSRHLTMLQSALSPERE